MHILGLYSIFNLTSTAGSVREALGMYHDIYLLRKGWAKSSRNWERVRICGMVSCSNWTLLGLPSVPNIQNRFIVTRNFFICGRGGEGVVEDMMDVYRVQAHDG